MSSCVLTPLWDQRILTCLFPLACTFIAAPLPDVFNPKHKSQSMRERMSDGHPDEPLLVYVGRLGAEKNTEALKDILTQVGVCPRGGDGGLCFSEGQLSYQRAIQDPSQLSTHSLPFQSLYPAIPWYSRPSPLPCPAARTRVYILSDPMLVTKYSTHSPPVVMLPCPALLPLQVPGARLALVGDGPQRQELEQMFKGMPVKFMVSSGTWGHARGAGRF